MDARAQRERDGAHESGYRASDQSVVYASSASIAEGDFQDGLHAVFRSTSSGDAGTWTGQVRNANLTKLNTVLFSNPLAAFLAECGRDTSSFFANQGWYDNAIAVDPTNPNIVFVGGIDLFRSDDGGVNWGLASHWWADKSAPPLRPCRSSRAGLSSAVQRRE